MQTPLAGVQARTNVSYLAHWVRNEDDACLHEVHKTCCAGTPGCVAVPGVVDWPSPHCRIRFVLRRIAQRAANNYKARARRPPREGRSGSANPAAAYPSTVRSIGILKYWIVSLSSCLTQIPITHAFHAVANRDGHIGRGDLADRTNKYECRRSH